MLGAVIFDMDGVLIDSHPIHREAWRELLCILDKPQCESQLDFILEGAKREEILRHFLGDLEQHKIAEYSRMKENLFRKKMDHVRTLPGVEEFLGELRLASIPRAIATSATRSRTHDMLQRLGLIENFSAIVTGDDVHKGKPDPAVFEMAARWLGLAPAQVVVFEDAVSGVQAAKAAGMKCVGIGEGQRLQKLREAGAELVVLDFVGLQLETIQSLFLTTRAIG